MSKPRLFTKADWITGAIAAILAFAVYGWTAAPGVTLLDAGEFIVAAQHFGVPHPTGYPLWTLLAWAFQLLPLGNVAWELAIFSAVCGALSVGLASMLTRNAGAWILGGDAPAWKWSLSAIAVGSSLLFAFSFSMWSQAVIVEVYTLHALLVGLYVTSLYVWIRHPDRLGGLYASFFLLSLAFSNHQLVLVFAIVPLQFLVVLLLRRDLFWDLFLAVAVCALIAYLAFASQTNQTEVLRAAIRLTYLVGTILALGLILKRGRLNWRLTAFIPILVAAGLLPYAYMPIASATNPPMNWGYTRTPAGFYASFNRSQYKGSLADQSLRALRDVLGVGGVRQPSVTKEDTDADPSTLHALRRWSSFFWLQIIRSFSPIGLLFFLAALAGSLRQPLPVRVWIYTLALAFIGAGFIQPVLDKARVDNSGWWLQMPYHTYTNLFFGLLCGIGALLLLRGLSRRRPRWRALAWAALILPAWPLWKNHAEASQRDHWFGWEFGHDMLKDLPKGSVIFGGTDPGRFIPTYMIFGESALPPSQRIDRDFHRRDLYILTQAGLADYLYLAYIRDQYSADRPRVKNAFEKWLGRERIYPDENLVLPTQEEMQALRKQAAKKIQDKAQSMTSKEVSQAFHGSIAQWIFEHNKDKHAFYVEESFPMKWSYPNAVPDGLIYRIEPEPLGSIPPAAVEKDFRFWGGYIAKLKADPNYANDFDARRSFSRLRLTAGNIYAFRKMNDEARRAFLEALDLWEGNLDAIIGIARIDWQRGEFDEPIALFEKARAADPNNGEFDRLLNVAIERKKVQRDIDAAVAEWQASPTLDRLNQAITLYSRIGASEKIRALAIEGRSTLGDTPQVLDFLIQVAESENDWKSCAELAETWTKVDPESAEAFYRLARAQCAEGRGDAALQSLAASIELGGVAFRERLFRDTIFAPLKSDPAFTKLMDAPSSGK